MDWLSPGSAGTSVERGFWGGGRFESGACDDSLLDRTANHADGPPSAQLGDDESVEEAFSAQVFGALCDGGSITSPSSIATSSAVWSGSDRWPTRVRPLAYPSRWRRARSSGIPRACREVCARSVDQRVVTRTDGGCDPPPERKQTPGREVPRICRSAAARTWPRGRSRGAVDDLTDTRKRRRRSTFITP